MQGSCRPSLFHRNFEEKLPYQAVIYTGGKINLFLALEQECPLEPAGKERVKYLPQLPVVILLIISSSQPPADTILHF